MTYYEFKDQEFHIDINKTEKAEQVVPFMPSPTGDIVINRKGQKVFKSANSFEVERLRDWSLENRL